MKQLTKFVRLAWQNWPRDYLVCNLVVMAVLGAVCLVAFSPGCATTPQGLAREQAVYSAATNVVGTATTLAPYVPAPFQVPTEAILGAISAALAAWNLHQQKAIKALKNGNGNGNGGAQPAASSPGS
jgi:hypothetical protein